MTHSLIGSALGLAFLLLPLSHAGAVADFGSEAKKILAHAGQKVGVSIRDPEGNEVFSQNSSQSLAPASIAKTVSTACSLNVLGPFYQFETVFGYKGKIQDSTLEGDIVIKGGGDPSLIIEDLREIVEKLRFVHGIQKITGNLIIDASFFGKDSLSMAEGFEGDEGRSFTAPLTPYSVNQNSFSFWITPDQRGNQKTRAVSLPANVVNVQITNKSKVGISNDVSVSYDPDKLQATIHGTMTKDAEPKGIYRSVDNSYQYALKLMQRLWVDSGGEWKNPEIKISTDSVKSVVLYRNLSRPLSKILMDVNKLSLNMGAEMIFLTAGAEKYGSPASYEKSMKLLGECLTGLKIKNGDIALTNGSGLSREANIKPSALSQFLTAYVKTAYAPEYLSSFGLSGLDGTVKSRMKEFPGRARLKTGSLKNVRSIAGFLYSQDGKAYSLAMIQNGVQPNDAKKLEDQIIEAFLRTH
jgi:serine-type D-Ala-D-Ala carboxypeptidase/endopeptidase (penicillin-binding protein 4)